MSDDFRVDIAMSGRGGRIEYTEPGVGAHTFECEFGGGHTMLVVYAPSSAAWVEELPWAAGRRPEVLERVAREIIRQKARGCGFVVHEGGLDIVERAAM
jgi:hypothetical protein